MSINLGGGKPRLKAMCVKIAPRRRKRSARTRYSRFLLIVSPLHHGEDANAVVV